MGGHPAVTAQSPRLKTGFDKSGTNQHDVGAGSPEFRSQRCEEPVQGMLAGTITGSSQQGCNACQAFNNDDDALTFDQAGHGGLCAVQRTKEIDIHDAAVDTGLRVDEGTSLGNTGIVYQDVDTAVQADNFFQRRCAFVFIDHITSNTHGIHTAGPEFVRRGLDAFCIHVQEPDSGAFAGKSMANSGADTVGRTGDDNHFIFKTAQPIENILKNVSNHARWLLRGSQSAVYLVTQSIR